MAAIDPRCFGPLRHRANDHPVSTVVRDNSLRSRMPAARTNSGTRAMSDRFTRVTLVLTLLLLAAMAAQPHLDRLIYSTPHPIAARGNLADAERTAIEIFQRVSPSVVQVAARPLASEDKPHPSSEQNSSDETPSEGEDLQAGSGIIWDAAGNNVTHSPLVLRTGAGVVALWAGDAL